MSSHLSKRTMLASQTLVHQWLIFFEKIQSWRWRAFQKTWVGKGKVIFPLGSHNHVTEGISIISLFFFFFFFANSTFYYTLPIFSLAVFHERSYKGISNSALLHKDPLLAKSVPLFLETAEVPAVCWGLTEVWKESVEAAGPLSLQDYC